MSNRNFKLTLDKACGMTFAQVAAKYSIHPSRAEQIYTATLRKLGLDRSAHATEIGLATQRHSVGYVYRGSDQTPEGFYWSGSLDSAY